MTTPIDRIGQRVFICPACTLTLFHAGRGRAYCTGRVSEPNAMQPHEEVEMVLFVRERLEAEERER